MPQLNLPAVFWEQEDENGTDAVVIVEDGVVIHIMRADGLEVRFLFHELEAVFDFVIEEIDRQEAMSNVTRFQQLPPF